MMKENLLYEGKAKKIYSLPDFPEQVLVLYKNDLTAFNALKKGSFDGKGSLNRDITSLIFKYLKTQDIDSHWIKDIDQDQMIVRKVDIIPLEVVVRNKVAGSLAKKMGVDEGLDLKQALVEFYFKKDELGDPFVSEDQIIAFSIADRKDIEYLKEQAGLINEKLKILFAEIGLSLVDFKIEFGKDKQGKIVLADEITPDCMRLWDHKTGEKLDKDRFRRDLGEVQESYLEVYTRLKNYLA